MAPKRSAWIIGVKNVLIVALLALVFGGCAPQTPATIEYVGRVLDDATQLPVAMAKVTLYLNDDSPVVYTDSEGVYRFIVPVEGPITAQVRVDASGYTAYTRNIVLSTGMRQPEDIRLILLVQQPQGPTPAILGPGVTLTPPTNTPISEVPGTPALGWCDAFDTEIDNERWEVPKGTIPIRIGDGALSFQVDERYWTLSEIQAWLEAKPPDRPIAEIAYTVILNSYESNVPGSVGIDIYLVDQDNVLSVDYGPSENGPEGEFVFCPNDGAEYDECDHPTPRQGDASLRLPAETPFQVLISKKPQQIEFRINDILQMVYETETQIDNFMLHVDADEGSKFQASVDNVCVTYAGNP